MQEKASGCGWQDPGILGLEGALPAEPCRLPALGLLGFVSLCHFRGKVMCKQPLPIEAKAHQPELSSLPGGQLLSPNPTPDSLATVQSRCHSGFGPLVGSILGPPGTRQLLQARLHFSSLAAKLDSSRNSAVHLAYLFATLSRWLWFFSQALDVLGTE